MTNSTRKVTQGRTMAPDKPGVSMGLIKILIIGSALVFGAIVVAAVMASCSLPMEQKSTLEQKQRESVVGKATTDIVATTKVEPPALTLDTFDKDGNKTSTVNVPASFEQRKEIKTAASEDSDSEAQGSASSEIKLPLSVAILIGSLGLILLAVAIFLLIKLASKSKAFTTGFQWVDSAAAGLVNNVANIASTSTNPEVISALKTVQADVERFRAEANKD